MSLSNVLGYFLPPKPFPDKELENTFLSDYSSRYLLNRQAALLIGLFTWTIYVVWDYFHINMLTPTLDNVSMYIYVARAIGTICLLYTSPSPRDRTSSRMPSSA